MRRPGNILLLAIVIGALGAAMVYRYLRQQQLALEAAHTATGGPTVDVMVANDTIPIGSRIEPNQVKVVRFPADAVPEGAIHTPEALTDRIARTTLEKNQPLLESQLVSQAAGLLPLIITEGMRGMSVKVDNVTGVSGFITPESHVDVIAAGTPDTGGGAAKQRSKLFLQNVKVLATGKSIEQRDNKPVEVPTVTLLVSPQEAEKLTLAARQEPVRLALRNYRDEAVVQTPGSNMAAIFGEEYKPPAPAAPVKVERRVERPRAPRYSVEILLGDKVSHQDFF
jgi:pilus assembly protein CpaB